MGCCSSKAEDVAPLRPRGGISSADPQPKQEERSAAQVEAEAARAQDWCFEHMTMDEVDLSSAETPVASKLEASSWIPTDAEAEVETEMAAEEVLPKLEGLTPAALIRAASKLPGMPTMLAASRLISEAPTADAAAFVKAGALEMLLDALEKPGAARGALQATMLCHAVSVLLRAPKGGGVRRLLRGHESEADRLTRLLCAAASRHPATASLQEACCGALTALCRRDGRSEGAGALSESVMAAGGVEVAVGALHAAGQLHEVVAVASSLLGELLACPAVQGRVGERCVRLKTVEALARAIKQHPHEPPTLAASLLALRLLLDATAPPFVVSLEQLAQSNGADYEPPNAAYARAAKQAQRASVPLLCTALLRSKEHSQERSGGEPGAASHALGLLAACVRCGGPVRRSCDQALAPALSACARAPSDASAAAATCELLALLPAEKPAPAQAAATLLSLLAAADSTNHTLAARGCAAVWRLSLRPRGLLGEGEGREAVANLPVEALLRLCVGGAIAGGPASVQQRGGVLRLALLATRSVLDSVEPSRAAAAAEALCGHGLLGMISVALGDASAAAAVAPPFAPALALVGCLMRMGSSCRARVLELSLARPRALNLLLGQPEVVTKLEVQLAAASVMRALLSANKSRTPSEATELVVCAEETLLRLLAAHPQSVSLCTEGCSALGQLAAVGSLRSLLTHPQPQLVTLPLTVLKQHGGSQAAAQAACWALRGLCVGGDQRSAHRLEMLLQADGAEPLMRATERHGATCAPLRSFCAELLRALDDG